ncbi:MAG: hypothetical protein H6850_02895 [Alphaproteobacteria bacterium]|nr:MAG: hypothetical protein H6850_02895 [Alphaproteobacteria bacterium]
MFLFLSHLIASDAMPFCEAKDNISIVLRQDPRFIAPEILPSAQQKLLRDIKLIENSITRNTQEKKERLELIEKLHTHLLKIGARLPQRPRTATEIPFTPKEEL